MAESKSKWFALFVNVRSEKSRKLDLYSIKRLVGISECWDAARDAPGGQFLTCPPARALAAAFVHLSGRLARRPAAKQ